MWKRSMKRDKGGTVEGFLVPNRDKIGVHMCMCKEGKNTLCKMGLDKDLDLWLRITADFSL